MKKLIFTISLVITSLTAFGQGQLNFQNNTATRITNGTLNAASSTATRVGLYIGNVGDSAGSLTPVPGSVFNCVVPGTFNGGVLTITGRGAGDVALQVRAWLATTVYGSYEAAYSGALGGDNSVMLGVSPVFTHTLTTGLTTPININTDAGYLAGSGTRLVPVVVPEPSSIALGLLGLGAVALFRRRK
jgi:hypothetical protein